MRVSRKTTQVLEAFMEYLHGCNKRITPERISILEVISKQNKVFTIEDLRERMAKEAFPVALATLYNTVELLIDAGLLKPLRLLDMSATLYRINMGDMSHIYMICQQCGSIEENNAKELSRCINGYDFPKFSPHSFTLSISGVCHKCRKLNTANETNKKKIEIHES